MSLFDIQSKAILEGRFMWTRPALWKRKGNTQLSMQAKFTGLVGDIIDENDNIELNYDDWLEATDSSGKPYYWYIFFKLTHHPFLSV